MATRTSTDHAHAHNLPLRPPFNTTITSPHSLSSALHARRAEYTGSRSIRIKIGTWNVAALPGTDKDVGAWFVDGEGVAAHLAGLRVAPSKSEVGIHTETNAVPEKLHEPQSSPVGKGNQHADIVHAQEDPTHRANPSSIRPSPDTVILPGGDSIGLYVLGLQEVIELTSAKEYLGRAISTSEHLGPITKWKTALSSALPAGYVCVAEQQLSGLMLLIYAAPDVAPIVSSVSSVSVGTGIMGYMGNKGAVLTRLVLGETTRLVFINCHLASGNDLVNLERRCWDYTQILQRPHFEPINWGGVLDDAKEGLGDEDFAFWFGDLNFRLQGLPGDDIRRLLTLHTRGEYDLDSEMRSRPGMFAKDEEPVIVPRVVGDDETEGSLETRTSSHLDSSEGDTSSSKTLPDPDDFVQDPSQDPASLQATLDSLLPHDQLRQAMKNKKAFHEGWREGPVTFLPTYKYDIGSMGMFDSSEKKRAPSWCDRILYRTRRDKLDYDGKTQEEELARLKDEEMKARGIDHAGDDDEVLYDYNPDEEGEDEQTAGIQQRSNATYDEYDENDDARAVLTREGYVDRIHLDVYTSHQRVVSSDHKPLDAIFTLEYDAVIPELKAKIQQEVARELDRAENEGRPGITVVVDRSQEEPIMPPADGELARQPARGDEGVEFGNVPFLKRKTRSLTIANTSQVPSTFAFVDRPGDVGEADRIAPSWLAISFTSSQMDGDEAMLRDLKSEITLEPGDAVNATLEIFIDDVTLVRALNEGAVQLEDVLVLRVTDGRDHFVPIRGTWLQSCFGRSIDELIHVPEGGVRALRPRPHRQAGGPINRGQEVCWSAPRELFKLTEAVEILTDRVIADSNMLEDSKVPEMPGWPFDERSWQYRKNGEREARRSLILEALDGDQNPTECLSAEIPALEKLEIISEVLIMFLKSLNDGIVPAEIWAKVEQEFTLQGPNTLTNAEETKAWVLDVLSASPNHNISFVFLTSMLQRVVNELAPSPKTGWRRSMVGSAKQSMNSVRRSLSLKSKPAPGSTETAVERRQAVVRAYADLFGGVICRGAVPAKERERKLMEERRREILEAFLNAGG